MTVSIIISDSQGKNVKVYVAGKQVYYLSILRYEQYIFRSLSYFFKCWYCMGEVFVLVLSFKLGKVFILVVRFIRYDSPPQKKNKKKKGKKKMVFTKDVGILQNTSWWLFYFKHWYMYEKAFWKSFLKKISTGDVLENSFWETIT